MASGLTTTTATSALGRETPTCTKETPETPEMDLQKRLKQLSMRTRETLKRLRSASVGQWWLMWVSGARQWVLGSSKAANAVCLAVFDPVTFCSLSQMAKNILRPRSIAHRQDSLYSVYNDLESLPKTKKKESPIGVFLN